MAVKKKNSGWVGFDVSFFFQFFFFLRVATYHSILVGIVRPPTCVVIKYSSIGIKIMFQTFIQYTFLKHTVFVLNTFISEIEIKMF